MTSSYNPGGGSLDFFARDQSLDISQIGSRSFRDYRNSLRYYPIPGPNGKPIPGVIGWELIIQNQSAGLGRVWGTARQEGGDSDRISSSTLLTDFPGAVSLPMLSTVDTVKHAGTTVNVTVSCNIFGVLAVANGGTANQCLAKDATGGPLTQITYTPSAAIISLSPATFKATSAALQLVVGRAGSAAQVLSDLTTGGPTSTGVMHANTASLSGLITSPLNSTTPGAGTHMMLANSGLYLLGDENAYSATPTAALTNVPRGGYFVGIVKLPNAPMRAYAVIPEADPGAQSMFVSTFKAGKLVSFNLEGTDPQDVRIPTLAGKCLWGFQWGDSVIVSDGFSMYQIDSTIHNLHVFTAEDKNYNDFYQIMGGFTYGGSLYAWVVKYLQTGGTATMSLRRYNPRTGGWAQTSADIALTNSANGFPYLSTIWTQPCAPSVPVSDAGWVQMPKLASVNYYVHQFQPLPDYEPFYMYTSTAADVAANAGVSKETSGSVTGPALLFEGYEGYPALIEEVVFMGDVASGGSTATVKLDFAAQNANSFAFSSNMSVTFSAADPMQVYPSDGEVGANWVRWPMNMDTFTRLRIKETLTQASDGRQSPNGVPYAVRGLIFTDRKVRTPYDVRGY